MSRSTMLRVALAGALVLSAVGVLLWARGGPRATTHVRIATGQRGGTFLPLGETLARGFSEDVPGVRFEALESAGSVASIERLARGEVELALVSNHVPGSGAVRLIAVLYEETLQIVVRRDAGIATPFDLRGRRVSVGPLASGTESIAAAVLHHFGIGDSDFDRRNITPVDAAAALERGELDAAFVVAGMRTPIVDRLLARDDMELLSLGDPARMGSSLEGIRLDAPYFAIAAIPEHAYGRAPREPVGTITVRALLVARADLDPELVRRITESLFEHKVELATEQQLLSHLTESFDLALSPYALHEGADAYYRRDEPTVVTRHVDEISLALTIGALIWSGLSALGSARRRSHRDRIEARYEEALALAKRARDGESREARREAHAALVALRDRALAELASEKLDANDSFVVLMQYLGAQILEGDARQRDEG